jgi:hypothetical protein
MFDSIKKFVLEQGISLVLGIKQVGDVMSKVQAFLSGKKTYLVAVASILAIIIAYANGAMDSTAAIKAIIEAILAITIRAGVSK